MADRDWPGSFQHLQGPGFGAAQQLLDFRPGRFDGIEVRRIGREIEQLGAHALNSLPYSVDFVRGQVVQEPRSGRAAIVGTAPVPNRPETRPRRWASPRSWLRAALEWLDEVIRLRKPTANKPLHQISTERWVGVVRHCDMSSHDHWGESLWNVCSASVQTAGRKPPSDFQIAGWLPTKVARHWLSYVQEQEHPANSFPNAVRNNCLR